MYICSVKLKLNALKHLLIANTVILFFAFGSFVHAQSYIKRASLSTAPISSQKGTYSVQQSVGFMGAMTTQEHTNHVVTRGFLLPQASALDEQIPQIEWSLYPVPFNTHLNIDFSAPVIGQMQVRMFDVIGQLVYDQSFTAKQTQKIDIHNLAQGEYLIQVSVMGLRFSSQILHYKTK